MSLMHCLVTLDDLRRMGFIAPDRFWKINPDCWGGCGPGRWGDYFVPDNIFGTNLKPACAVHDVCWEIAVEEQSLRVKYQGDFDFLLNMQKLIERDRPGSFWGFTWLKHWFAEFYFKRVWNHIPLKLKNREGINAHRIEDLYRYSNLGHRGGYWGVYVSRVLMPVLRAFDAYWERASWGRGRS